jgi:hypothetical protein
LKVECYKRVENYEKLFISVRKSRLINKNIQYTTIRTESNFSKEASACKKESGEKNLRKRKEIWERRAVVEIRQIREKSDRRLSEG